MKIPLSWIGEYVKLSKSEQANLAGRLPQAGIEVSGVETVDGEPVLELEITANRGDLLSVFGMAWEIAAIYCRNVKTLPQPQFRPPAMRGAVSVDKNSGCRRYLAARIENVRVAPSPELIAARLRACGFAIFNNVVDITNYLLIEFGQPLHAFDAGRLHGPIRVRRSRPKERIAALDGKTYELSDDLVIADDEKPVAIAGVIGGAATAVSETTRAVFLECAWFDPSTVRRTSRRLGVTTESSFRFERHVNPNLTERVFFQAIRLIEELTGGKCAGVEMAGAAPKPRRAITVSQDDIERVLGIRLPPRAVLQTLVSLGCRSVRTVGKQRWTVTPPHFRPDLTIPEDLIEEFMRLHGLDDIPSRVPSVRPVGSLSEDRRSPAVIRRAALASGLTETVQMSFIAEESLMAMGVSPKDAVPLENPLSLAASHLRPTLLPGILSTASLNLRRGSAASIRLFEIGPVFLPGPVVREELRLAVVLSGSADPIHFSRRDRPVDFYDLKGIVEMILRSAGRCTGPVEYVPANVPGFDPAASSAVRSGGASVGCLGRILAKTAAAFDLPQDCFAAELGLSRILAFASAPPVYRPLPRFPSIRRDLSLTVRTTVSAASLQQAVAEADIPNLTECQVFDIYRGKGLAEGTYAIGLSFTFQSPDRTLSDEEAKAATDSILSLLSARVGAALREIGAAKS